jgi:multiple sugar transport system substrate-binding protein
MKKIVIPMLTLLFSASIFAAEIRVTIAEYSSKTGPYFDAAKKAFEKKYPGITVNNEVIPWANLKQKLTTDIAGDANADLAIIGTRWLVDFVDQDLVEPLDNYMKDGTGASFIPTFLSPSNMRGATYGLPIAASARALYYNKSLFSDAGIDNAPATWIDVITSARKITQAKSGVHGFCMQGESTETDVYFYYALWSFGGDILNENGESGLGSKSALLAAKMYKMMIDEKLTQPGVTTYTRNECQELFKEGRVAMTISLPFVASQIKEEKKDVKYGITAVPSGSRSATYGVTDSIIMFSNSKNKEAAWKFLNFIFTQEWRSKFTIGEGFLPVNTAVSQESYFVNNPDLKPFAKMLPSAFFAPVIPGWSEIADATSSALQKIYTNQEEPESALATAEKEINSILASN